MTVKEIQQRLLDLGFDPKGVDGKIGKNTIDALKSFQASKGLPQTGLADDTTISALLGQSASTSPINRDAFYARLRTTSLFPKGFSASQIVGINTLLDALDRHKVTGAAAAYILAGVYHETGARMVPVREGFATTNQGAVNAVTSLFKRGKISTNYALSVNGVSYYGRGRIQNTWEDNYRALEKRFGRPFLKNPDILLENEIDAEVTVVGHIEGIWTKGRHKLATYINDRVVDFPGARRIVNGTDRKDMIAGYAREFLTAVR